MKTCRKVKYFHGDRLDGLAKTPHLRAMQGKNASVIGDSGEVTFAWVVGLRWSAIIGQLAIILFTHFFLVELSLKSLLLVLGCEAIFNLGCVLWIRLTGRCDAKITALTLAVDILFLTSLLHLSGGPGNPFNFLYLVYIVLAVVILGGRMECSLWAMSLAGFGFLFMVESPLEVMGHHGGMHHGMHHGMHDGMDLHLKGMWVAFGVAGAFIIYFVDKVKRAIGEQQIEIQQLRKQEMRQQRLASLATLSAGAAHELSTPLGTIAVVAGELERSLKGRADCGELVEDLVLVRSEIGRCHAVLSQMAFKGGQVLGAKVTTTPVVELLESAVAKFNTDRVVLGLPEEASELKVTAPEGIFVQALYAVIGNALDASSDPVHLELRNNPRHIEIKVRDAGEGMSAQTLERATEPFFTTKEPGRGMGLGLFLTQTIVEHLGGQLGLNSAAGQGTEVRIVLPHAEGGRA